MIDSNMDQTTTMGFRIDRPTEIIAKAIYYRYLRIVAQSGKKPNITEEHSTAIDQCALWLTKGTTYGLKILGKPGTGKSTLLKAICEMISDYSNSISSRSQRCYVIDKNASEITEESLLDTERYKLYYNYKFLAIDDLGTEPLTIKHYGNEIMPVVDIIRRRCDNWKQTIIVSNLDGSSIKDRYKDRIHDRLRDMTTICLNGESNRGSK